MKPLAVIKRMCLGTFLLWAPLGCALVVPETGQGTDKGAGTNPNADATHWGDWELMPYLDEGWSGYAIRTRIDKEKPGASYSCGDNCTNYIRNSRCNGDCPFTADVTIVEVGERPGHRAAGNGAVLGQVKQFDNGSVEETRLLTAGDVTIALINESEAGSRLGFDEAQVTMLTGFDRSGQPMELGHIEEMDAPNTVTQPETLYRRVDGQDEFITTVIERVLFNDETNNTEWVRLSTQWCQSAEWKHIEGIAELVKSDAFALDMCNADTVPIMSYVDNGAGGTLKQLFSGRSDSNVRLWQPETGERDALRYRAGTGTFWQFGDGTQYRLADPDDELRYTFINSYVQSSKQNCTYQGSESRCHSPKLKMLHVNWSEKDDYEGVEHGWAVNSWNPFASYDPGEQWLERTDNPDATALIVNEIRDDVAVDTISGAACEGQGFFEGNEEYARRCKLRSKYVLNFYILFPPETHGQQWSRAKQVKFFDRVLAAMPDQTQSSPELHAAEEYLDYIRALERLRAAGGDPRVVDFDLLVDMNTEEDHSTARKKIWDLFTDFGQVEPRQHRDNDEWPEAVAEPSRQGGNADDEPLF